MTEYQVNLQKAHFNFDLDILEHVATEIPLVSGGDPLYFDHQQRHLRQGDTVVLAYPVINVCYWQSAKPAGLECCGSDGSVTRFCDPDMDAGQAKEILFRLANICEWAPQNGPPAVASAVEPAVEVPFNPAAEFRLPRESKMVSFAPAADWTKADDLVITHEGQPLAVTFDDSKNQLLLAGQFWHRLDEIKEAVFKLQECSVEFVFPDARWALNIGNERPAQIFESRVKAWSRTHRFGIAEAVPDSGRNVVALKVDLMRAVLEGGQIRIRGNREVLFHHIQQCIRLDGEVFGQYKDITQIRVPMMGDRLSVRLWIQPKTLFVLEATSPCDINTARIPDFIRALLRATNMKIEE